MGRPPRTRDAGRGEGGIRRQQGRLLRQGRRSQRRQWRLGRHDRQVLRQPQHHRVRNSYASSRLWALFRSCARVCHRREPPAFASASFPVGRPDGHIHSCAECIYIHRDDSRGATGWGDRVTTVNYHTISNVNDPLDRMVSYMILYAP